MFRRWKNYGAPLRALLLVTALLAASSTTNANDGSPQPLPWDQQHAIAYAISMGDYEQAEERLHWYRQEWRNVNDVLTPTFDLIAATIALAEAVDLGVPLDSASYFLPRERALERFQFYVDSPLITSYHTYGLASLYALEAQRQNEIEGNPLHAVGPAKASARWYTRTLELYPYYPHNWHDPARLGLAVYHFWRSHVLRFVNWTPLSRDRREESLATLDSLLHRPGRPIALAAGISLAWARIEMDEPEQAAQLADSLIALYGEARSLLEPAGKAHYLAGNWAEARERYHGLLRSLREAPHQHHTRMVGVLNRLVAIAAEQGDWRSVLDWSDLAAELPLTEDKLEKEADNLARIEKHREEALQHLKHPDTP